MDEKEQKPVKVVDKRHFTHGGERREPDAAGIAFPQEAPTAQPSAGAEAPKARPAQGEPSEQTERESSGFAEFILSLSSSAFVNLGQIPNPMTGRAEMDLEAAASIIDVLQILQLKTQGNLTPYEKQVMDQTLYQLKLLYVQARHRSPS